MFWKHKKERTINFDKTGKIPVIRSSICTGEQVAGFKDTTSGKFIEIMLIRNDGDLSEFLRLYGVREEDVRREW
ncbi:MAG: aspartate dehydrogenase [Oscillospiraceae bacterium]|nr:aspartate dehydrogenase [Oscillospiraceae bacterium]